MSGAAAGPELASLTVPRERERIMAELGVTPHSLIVATPFSIPDPSIKWNWISGDFEVGSVNQKPPASHRFDTTGPF